MFSHILCSAWGERASTSVGLLVFYTNKTQHRMIWCNQTTIIDRPRNDYAISYLWSTKCHSPVYINNLLVRYEHLRSTDKYLLQISQTHLKTYGDRAFLVATPRVWNALPMEIKLRPSVSVFKNRLKTHLFRATYNY